MDLKNAASEPMVRFKDFHNTFNRNVKLTFGAIEKLGLPQAAIELPTGDEPWGESTRWGDLGQASRKAAVFISEMGVVRATSAFEDYIVSSNAELDRASAREHPGRREGLEHDVQASDDAEPEDAEPVVRSWQRLLHKLSIDQSSINSDILLLRFFEVARNCIVHRSNRASKKLVTLRQSKDFGLALINWPQRKGKWALTIPEIVQGRVVDWLPRHSILASAIHYRCAQIINRAVVDTLGEDGIVTMAAHWCLLTENPVPCPAKLDPQTMVRTQLVGRYFVPDADNAEIIAALRKTGVWDSLLSSFAKRGLVKASHAKRRAARR